MIFKLSLKNLKAHVPNYLVYYISMTFAAVVYYCFRAQQIAFLLANVAKKLACID